MGVEQEILDNSHIVAIVGLSSKAERASNHVGCFLQEKGYKIIPVNPAENTILNEPCFPNLSAIPGEVDVVDIFRRPEEVMPIVEEAIKIKAKAVWMQEGIANEAAAGKAREAGLKVVMNKCMLKEYVRIHSGAL